MLLFVVGFIVVSDHIIHNIDNVDVVVGGEPFSCSSLSLSSFFIFGCALIAPITIIAVIDGDDYGADGCCIGRECPL